MSFERFSKAPCVFGTDPAANSFIKIKLHHCWTLQPQYNAHVHNAHLQRVADGGLSQLVATKPPLTWQGTQDIGQCNDTQPTVTNSKLPSRNKVKW